MHSGQDTAYYLQKGFSVVAFEAHPALATAGRKRFAEAIASQRLTIVEGAIVDPALHPTGRVTFYENPGNSHWGTVDPEWVQRNERLGEGSRALTVDVVDFVACIERYGVPRYLKIDIEGADRLCLEALAQFEERPAFLSIESEKVHFADLESDIALLEQLGYESFQVINQPGVPRRKEPRTNGEGQWANYQFEFGSSGPFGLDLPDAWLNKSQTLRRYKLLFAMYKRFGDEGTWKKAWPWRAVHGAVRVLSRRTLPGWHDLHARHVRAARGGESR